MELLVNPIPIPTLNNLKKKPFENIVGKGENAVVSIFSFSHNVFNPIKYKSQHFSYINTFPRNDTF